MRTKTKTKAIVILAITLLALSLFIAVKYNVIPIQAKQNAVMSLSQFYLNKEGAGVPGGLVEDGAWRIMGTTGGVVSENFTFLTIDNNLATRYGAYGAKPYNITGSVTMGIFQNTQPYWHIPLIRLKDLEVYPSMTGSYNLGKSSYTIPAKEVSVWGMDTSQKELVIPFSIGVIKTVGSNAGSLYPDDPTAKKISTPQGDYYQFEKSYKSVAEGQTPSVITFKTADNKEYLVLTLQFTVGGLEYDWTKDWVIITEKGGGEVTNNIFPRSTWDNGQLESLLNWRLGNAWSFYNYWFGGGTVFTGKAHIKSGSSSIAVPFDMGFGKWDDGTTAPLMVKYVSPSYGTFTPVLDEGYSYGGSNTATNTNYQYPGWYVPAPDNKEGILPAGISTSDWWNYRLPAPANLHDNNGNLKPDTKLSDGTSKSGGLSIVNYLSAQIKAPTTAAPTKSVTFTQMNINVAGQGDVWGQGASGLAGDNAYGIKVFMPNFARQWVCTIDISTRLVGTIVVTQTYPDISIEAFSVDRSSVGSGESALVSVTLKNKGTAPGYVSIGIPLPSAVSGTCSVTGGNAGLYMTAGETRSLNLYVKNTGNLEADTTATFTFQADNHLQQHTRTFTLTFLKGLNVADTTINIRTQLQDNNAPIDGLEVKVFYGVSGTETQKLITNEGSATFNLGKYYGVITIYISDPNSMRPDGPFPSKQDVITLKQGANEPVTYKFAHSGQNGVPFFIWILVAVAVIIALIVLIAVAYIKRRR